MTGADPFPMPTRFEHRNPDPPEHTDRPRPPLTGPQARAIARERLDRWITENRGINYE